MEADPVLFDRFQREGEIGETLDHRSDVYMVMEWVEGRLLRHVLRACAT
jgi:eukaryotic-like serine/threonine-protein kinase